MTHHDTPPPTPIHAATLLSCRAAAALRRETLLEWHRRLPRAALAFSGWPVAQSLKFPHWTENYLIYGNELHAPHPVSVIRGNTGYLVSRWMTHRDSP